MSLLERIVKYSQDENAKKMGLRLDKMIVGVAVMETLLEELKKSSGVELPNRGSFVYKGIFITQDSSTGTNRVDATWVHTLLTQPGKPLADK